MGTKISHKRRKCPNRGRCSYQQHSSENTFGRQRVEKAMDTKGSSAWWTRTWSRVEQHQAVCKSQMGGQQGAGVHGGEVVRVQGSTWAAAGGGGDRWVGRQRGLHSLCPLRPPPRPSLPGDRRAPIAHRSPPTTATCGCAANTHT